MVCKPKRWGGLGVLDLKTQNEALLLKFLHKFYNKMDIPWVQLTWGAFYEQKIPHAVDSVGLFWWRDILKLTPIFRGITKVNVVCGTTVLFWKDMWLDAIMSDAYPRAFSFTKNEDISVKNFLEHMSLREAFHLPLSPQAFEEVKEIQMVSTHMQPMTTTHDVW